MMNRLLVRRCSMSSIEEEDESEIFDETITETEKLLPTSLLQEQFNHTPSICEWDSELSESEQEFDDNNENLKENSEEQAANRALQCFKQSFIKTQSTPKNNFYSPFSIQVYDNESAELDAIMSELQDFKAEFEDNSNSILCQQQSPIPKYNKIDTLITNHNSTSSTTTKYSSSLSTNGCVHELRTLEDQLEAALASLSLTINDCTPTSIDCQQPISSDSSACSSGVGDDIANESFHPYNLSNSNHHTVSFPSKINIIADDCDSAFSDCGSNDKVTLINHDDSMTYRSLIPPLADPITETPSIVLNDDDALFSNARHPPKILVRTYNDDDSTKSIFIDDSMLIRDVVFVLVHKNHREPDVNHALVEVLPDLHMERVFEDHQKLAEAILMWPTVSTNKLCFTKRFEKYCFFRTINLNDEFTHAPDVEGNIYLKEKSRKSWKKHFCVLRSSGLYFIPKGKSKKDLVCLAKFENVELFFGLDWQKKFKSPSDFCFALKHPLIQKKSSKYIKYMCVETKTEFDRWITNIRIAKFGQQLKTNYIIMEKAMSIYRSTGRFGTLCSIRSETPSEQSHKEDFFTHRDLTSPLHNQYYEVRQTVSTHHNNEDDRNHYVDDYENSPIKSASYMDELRQRLERVLNNSPQACLTSYSPIPSSQKTKEVANRPTLIPPPKLKPVNSQCLNSTENLHKPTHQMKPPITVGSTPLPRKQIQPYGSLSYRTMNTNNRQHQQQMSKSFIIPTKRDDHRSTGSLSTASKSDSLNLETTDFSIPSSTFLESLKNTNKIINPIKPKPIVSLNIGNTNRSKPLPPLKKTTIPFNNTNIQSHSTLNTKTNNTPLSLKVSTSAPPIPKPNRLINSSVSIASTNNVKNTIITANSNKLVPPVPPRKSSIPRPNVKPSPPQRNLASNCVRRPHVSHL